MSGLSPRFFFFSEFGRDEVEGWVVVCIVAVVVTDIKYDRDRREWTQIIG